MRDSTFLTCPPDDEADDCVRDDENPSDVSKVERQATEHSLPFEDHHEISTDCEARDTDEKHGRTGDEDSHPTPEQTRRLHAYSDERPVKETDDERRTTIGKDELPRLACLWKFREHDKGRDDGGSSE